MIYLILSGFLSGVISGMGMGGGIILLPILTMFLGFERKIAQGIVLIYFIPTAVFALIVHIKNKTADLKLTLKCAVTGIFGAFFGAVLMNKLSSPALGKIFSVFMIAVGISQIISALKQIIKQKNQ